MFKIVIMYNIDLFTLKIILFLVKYNNSLIVLILSFTDEADV